MKLRITWLFCLLFIILALQQTDWACSCGRLSPREAYREYAAIFSGTVISERPSIDFRETYPIDAEGKLGKKESHSFDVRIYTIETDETFKGKTGARVEITSEEDGCGYEFEIGRKYLVFACEGKDKTLHTGLCNRTRPIEEARDDIEILHKFKSGITETRVFGLVRRSQMNLSGGYGSTNYVGGLSGAVVIAKSPTSSLQTTTDAEGRYRFIDLPAGTYTIAATIPNGKIGWSPRTVEINDDTGGGELDFTASIDADIAGRIWDSEGKPVSVTLTLAHIERKDGRVILKEKQHCSHPETGQYKFEAVPPGQYVIGVNIDEAPKVYTPYATMYYPETPDLNKATIIEVREGQDLAIDVLLLPALPMRTFKGTVVRADGKPPRRISVQLYELDDQSNGTYAAEVNADQQGNFEIKGFPGLRYCLHAYEVFYSDPMQTELVPVTPDGDMTSIKLVLLKPGSTADLKRRPAPVRDR